MEKGHTVPTAGLRPHEGTVSSERIPQYLLIRMTYARRIVARDLLFDGLIVRRETLVETGRASDFSGHYQIKEARCSASKCAIRLKP
jgi:hypothetical protein